MFRVVSIARNLSVPVSPSVEQDARDLREGAVLAPGLDLQRVCQEAERKAPAKSVGNPVKATGRWCHLGQRLADDGALSYPRLALDDDDGPTALR